MRVKLFVVVAILALVAGMSVEAGLIPGVSFQLVEDKTTEVHAGITQMVTFSDSPGGQTTAFVKGGFLVVPQDRYGVFSEMSYLRMDPMVLGIKPEFLMKVESDVSAKRGVTVSDDGSAVVNIGALAPGVYDILTSVTNNEGRRDTTILVVFHEPHHIEGTDMVAGVFGVVDASRYVEMFCHFQLGIDDPETMSPEDRYICKSVYFDSRLKGVLEFSEAVADFSWLSQGLALRLQGMNPPMAPAGPDPAQDEYQRQVGSLTEELRLLREQLTAPKSDPEPAVTTQLVPEACAPVVTKTTQELLQEKYAGKVGYVFYSSASVTKSWWLLSSRGWKRCDNNLVVTPEDEMYWLYDASDQARLGWIGFGLGEGDAEPTDWYPLDAKLTVLEVK